MGEFGLAFAGGALRGFAQGRESAQRHALEKEEHKLRGNVFKLREQEHALAMKKLEMELLGRGGLAQALLGEGGQGATVPPSHPFAPQPSLPGPTGAGQLAPSPGGLPVAPPLGEAPAGGEVPGGAPFAPEPVPSGGRATRPLDPEQAGRRRIAASMILAGMSPPAELLTGAKPFEVSPGATVFDPGTRQPIFQAPQAEPKPPATATELNDLALTLKGRDFRFLNRGERLEVSTELEKQKREFEKFKASLRAAPEPSPGKRIVELAESLRKQNLLTNDLEESIFIQQMTVRPDIFQRAEQDQGILMGITAQIRQRIQQRQIPPTAPRRERPSGADIPGAPGGAAPGAPVAPPSPGPTGPAKSTPSANFDFPPEIQTTGQAVRHLMVRFGMSEQEAREFVKKQQGAPSGKKAR